MLRTLSSLLFGASMLVAIGCSDPYTQTVEAPEMPGYSGFSRAMKKLPTEEKNLVNDYAARKAREGVRPAGITLREAMDDQRRYEREQQDLARQLIGGIVKIAEAMHSDTRGDRVSQPAYTPPPLIPLSPSPDPLSPVSSAAPVVPSAPGPAMVPGLSAASGPSAVPNPSWGRPVPITGLELSEMLKRVEAHPMPSDRLMAVKGYAEDHWFTTAQAIALAETVLMPNDKVEALGALYPRVVDPEHFESAYGVLTFPMQRAALRRRIEAFRGR